MIIASEIEKGLNLLVQHCKDYAEKMEAKVVPVSMIERAKEIIIENLKIGVESATENTSFKDRIKVMRKKN